MPLSQPKIVPLSPLPTQDFIASLLRTESDAIHTLSTNPTLLDGIGRAASMIIHSTSPLIVAGVGKSGHIARKIASTFCSLGKPASFLHPAEASHGDLGLIGKDAVLLILSNSGETSELSDLLAYATAHQHAIIGLTANPNSTLGRLATVALAYGKQPEICRNGLAPTTSTTVSLAIGDALAVTVSEIMQIQPEDFRRYHPGGKLGARLAKIGQIMRGADTLPFVRPTDTLREAIVVMSQKNLGLVLVQDQDSIVGILTDGDLRRNIDALDLNMLVQDIATPNPVSITPDLSMEDALAFMNSRKITSCVVRDPAATFLGLVTVHDCLGAQA
jgi:arabinose-5-phosphate isomerase